MKKDASKDTNEEQTIKVGPFGFKMRVEGKGLKKTSGQAEAKVCVKKEEEEE